MPSPRPTISQLNQPLNTPLPPTPARSILDTGGDFVEFEHVETFRMSPTDGTYGNSNTSAFPSASSGKSKPSPHTTFTAFTSSQPSHRSTSTSTNTHAYADAESSDAYIFAGTSTGQVVLFNLVSTNAFGVGFNAGKTHNSVEKSRFGSVLKTGRGHLGGIGCIVYTRNVADVHSAASLTSSSSTPASHGLLITGSADRTIKLWNICNNPLTMSSSSSPSSSSSTAFEPCLQTLTGHGSTITAIQFCTYELTLTSTSTALLSTSRDKTLRIWRPAPDRDMLREPFYACTQVLNVGDIGGGGEWYNCMAVRGGEDWKVFCGDSSGGITVYKIQSEQQQQQEKGQGKVKVKVKVAVKVKHRWPNVHKLSIQTLELVESQNFLISLAYDCTVAILDSVTGSLFHTITNTSANANMNMNANVTTANANANISKSKNQGISAHAHLEMEIGRTASTRKRESTSRSGLNRYTGVAWDEACEQLLLCDVSGNLEAHNIYVEKKVAGVRIAENEGVGGMLWNGNDKGKNRFFVLFPESGEVQEWMVRRDLGCTRFDTGSGSTHDYRHRHHRDGGHGHGHSHGDDGREEIVSICVISGSDGDDSSETESMLFTCSLNNTITCWDTYDNTQRFNLRDKDNGIEISCMSYIRLPSLTSLTPTNESGLIITGNDDGSIKLWNPDSAGSVPVHVEKRHGNTVTCIEVVSAANGVIATAGFDGAICVWVVDGARLRGARAIRKDGREGGKEKGGMLEFYMNDGRDGEDDTDEGNDNGYDNGYDEDEDEKQNNEILALHYHVESGLLASGGNDGVIRVWDLGRGILVHKWSGLHGDGAHLDDHEHSHSHATDVEDIAITCLSGDGSHLFSGGVDGVVAIWNISKLTSDDYSSSTNGNGNNSGNKKKNRRVGRTKNRRIGAIKAHTGDKYGEVVSESESEKNRTMNGEGAGKHGGGGGGGVKDMQFIPTSGYLLTCGSDCRVCLWDYTRRGEDGKGEGARDRGRNRDGYLLSVFRHHSEIPTSLAYKEVNKGGEGGRVVCVFVGTKEGSILKFKVKGDLIQRRV